MKRKNRILIIDDDAATIRLLQRVFKSRYKVATASTGEEGLALISHFHPDLILLDIEMPGMGGYVTCERIKQDEKCSTIKVLLVSGHSSIDERLKGYESGADDYVSKPFDNGELRAKVDVFMRLKRVEEFDSIKSNLLALFSHETRTPLSCILGMSELLLTDDELPRGIKNQVKIIHHNGQRLLRFIEKAAFLSDLRAGMDLDYEPGSLKRHLNSVAGDRDRDAEKRNVQLCVDCPEDIELNADWHSLDEVLGYILDNAVKYTKQGTQVSTRAQLDDRNCIIEIADEGEGIAPEWIDNIFEEFSIRDIMHHKEGQGLSLAIAKQVIELHSGEISVVSRPGFGSVFRVRLPVLSAIDILA